MEQAKGHHGNNVVTVLLQSGEMDIQAAADYAGAQFKRQVQEFTTDKGNIPSWGTAVDSDVSRCIQGLEHWFVGNIQFSGETDRYLSPNEKLTLVVTLRKPDVEAVEDHLGK